MNRASPMDMAINTAADRATGAEVTATETEQQDIGYSGNGDARGVQGY